MQILEDIIRDPVAAGEAIRKEQNRLLAYLGQVPTVPTGYGGVLFGGASGLEAEKRRLPAACGAAPALPKAAQPLPGEEARLRSLEDFEARIRAERRR